MAIGVMGEEAVFAYGSVFAHHGVVARTQAAGAVTLVEVRDPFVAVELTATDSGVSVL